MNKLIKLIYVNILDIGDFNRINMSRQSSIRDNSELKIIIFGLIFIVFGISLYKIYNFLTFLLVDKINILNVSLIIGTVALLMKNLFSISGALFNGSEIEMLYSLPISKKQIVLSKIFKVYVNNIFILLIICFPAILAYNNYVKVDETICFVYFLIVISLPFVPIILSSVCSFISNYIKTNRSKLFYNVSRILFFLVLIGLVFLMFRGLAFSDVNTFIKEFIGKCEKIYPFFLINNIALEKLNILVILIALFLPFILIYLFITFLSYNYLKICSLLKGVKLKKKFVLKKLKRSSKNNSLLKKELLCLVSNKTYLFHTLYLGIICSLGLFVICAFLPKARLVEIEYFEYYFNLYVPNFLAAIASLNCYSVSSLSVEGENILFYKVLPIKFGKVLFIKWLFGILINVPIIIFNAIVLNIFFETDLFMKFISILFPLMAVVFVSVLGILLDFNFCAWKEKNKNVIIKQRLIVYVPLLISLFIGIIPLLCPLFAKYRIIVSTYTVILFLGACLCLVYILINYKKIKEKLFK